MEAALTGKKPALPPRPDSSCSHASSVTYLSRISQLELLTQELEVQLQASLAENLKLKEQVKRYASEESRWNAAEQELKTQLSVLTDDNLALNSTVTALQAQLSSTVLPARHTKTKSLATDHFLRTVSTSAKEPVASVSLRIRDMRPALTEASTEDLRVQTVSLTEISGNHQQLQSLYRTAGRGRPELENTRPMRDRSGSASRLAVAKYTPFSVRMVKRTKETQETHVNVPKVSEVRQGAAGGRTQRKAGGSVDFQFLSL